MKKVCLLALVLVMVVTLFTGCSGTNDNATFVGKWDAAIDLTDMMNENMANNQAMAGQKFKEITMVLSMEFKDDDTYKMEFTEAAATDLVTALKSQMKDIMLKALEAQVEGTGVSVEDALAASGTDLDEVIDESMSVESVKQMLSGMDGTGQFIARDGKLYLSDSVDYAPAQEKGMVYEVNGEGISLVKVEGGESTDTLLPGEQLLPMELTRAK